MKSTRMHWSLYFLVVTLGIAVLGAVLGMLAFVLIGLITGADFKLIALVRNGAETGAFYFTLWAPGIAVVLCVKRAYENRQPPA
ncbi:MAG TPA: hypothetical protein VL357_07100 [Rariglobus sp.]|nr:hypothetical protein [Rariglobus sp.]